MCCNNHNNLKAYRPLHSFNVTAIVLTVHTAKLDDCALVYENSRYPRAHEFQYIIFFDIVLADVI